MVHILSKPRDLCRVLHAEMKGEEPHMLRKGMYVRCPADYGHQADPRIFICCQVKEINDFEETVTVESYDPFRLSAFFTNLPVGILVYPIDSVKRCHACAGSDVILEGQSYEVLAVRSNGADLDEYYLRNRSTDEPIVRNESKLVISFVNGDIDPSQQLKEYEFQNPAWFVGRSIVSKSMSILDNSINYFKDLAGSRIRLLPHQVNTVLRCLQENPCRFLLADEVGMGKTVEALSILKIFLRNNSDTRSLVIVPAALKEQWRIELLLKFNAMVGRNENNNWISITTVDELASSKICDEPWDFIIIDEVHRYIGSRHHYELIHDLSMSSNNVLLLSATPVQQYKEEYLDLLRLLDPGKYNSYDLDQFSRFLDLQGRIIQRTALILDDLDDYKEEIASSVDEGINPHDSEECSELFGEIVDGLGEICTTIKDERLRDLLDEVTFDNDDCGTEKIRVVISYICSNYQLESNIIRNRRKLLEANDDGSRLLSRREMIEVTYDLDNEKNTYEALCYRLIMEWLDDHTDDIDVDGLVKPLLGSFFSSPWAFCAFLERCGQEEMPIGKDLLSNAQQWASEENYALDSIVDILEDPFSHEPEYCTRIVSTLNTLYEDLYNKKVVLFTNYGETFSAYKSAIQKVFDPDEASFFSSDMPVDELELQAYNFQNDPKCRIMLCDYTGGEGRNFQCADYVLHIDLPWDANQIEQRIGRLDRLERDPDRPVVTSVVVHSTDSFEAALFDFFNRGLKVFTQSLSGMEIIMGDINREIKEAIREDCRFGLVDRIPAIIERIETMRDTVRKEQNYDAAGFLFKPLFVELKRLIDYYADNENMLFSNAITGWANLAGFVGHKEGNGIISYSAHSFSTASAVNSQLIPPKWDDYLESEQNRFVSGVQESYSIRKGMAPHDRAIRGTFMRDLALKSDYIHFFAPGDAVFDCIVNNAMNSYRGRSAAFSVRSLLRWVGLMFTWSLKPDEACLMDAGVSLYALAPYRGFVPSEQIIVPVSMHNPDSLDEAAVVREYQRILSLGYQKNSFKHLGRRGNPRYETQSQSPIEQFKASYPKDRWKQFVERARDYACKKARATASRKVGITNAREEMERVLSAREATAVLYGGGSTELENLKREQGVVLRALSNPVMTLDSIAYVRMV